MGKVKKQTGGRGERNAKGRAKLERTRPRSAVSKRGSTRAATGRREAAETAGRKAGRDEAGTRKPGARKADTRKAGITKGKSRAASKQAPANRSKGAARGAAATVPQRRVAVTPLDPLRKCGPNTSVQALYRVDESVDGRRTPHLVFYDRHGWYCEHGRSCPAVGDAKKYDGQIARVS